MCKTWQVESGVPCGGRDTRRLARTSSKAVSRDHDWGSSQVHGGTDLCHELWAKVLVLTQSWRISLALLTFVHLSFVKMHKIFTPKFSWLRDFNQKKRNKELGKFPMHAHSSSSDDSGNYILNFILICQISNTKSFMCSDFSKDELGMPVEM